MFVYTGWLTLATCLPDPPLPPSLYSYFSNRRYNTYSISRYDSHLVLFSNDTPHFFLNTGVVISLQFFVDRSWSQEQPVMRNVMWLYQSRCVMGNGVSPSMTFGRWRSRRDSYIMFCSSTSVFPSFVLSVQLNVFHKKCYSVTMKVLQLM